jgi:hypothetical protein
MDLMIGHRLAAVRADLWYFVIPSAPAVRHLTRLTIFNSGGYGAWSVATSAQPPAWAATSGVTHATHGCLG